MSDNGIEIKELVKYYDGRCVLDGINLDVPKSCIYGLLGRNGAGKTTIIRILLGLEHATRGTTCISGRNSSQLDANDHGRIGYVAEGHNLIQNYKVGRVVEICRNLSLKWNQQFFDHLIKTFRLPMDRRIKQLSAGMRAQLNLSLAMAIEPEVLILDDPTLGLDTVARRQFLELALDVLQQDGRTILFCSHILSDVERIVDRIGILVAGKLVVDCSLDELKSRVRKWRIIFDGQVPMELHMTDIIRCQKSDNELVITVANWDAQKQAMIDTYKPSSCTELAMSLEDIFIECTHPNPMPITL